MFARISPGSVRSLASSRGISKISATNIIGVAIRVQWSGAAGALPRRAPEALTNSNINLEKTMTYRERGPVYSRPATVAHRIGKAAALLLAGSLIMATLVFIHVRNADPVVNIPIRVMPSPNAYDYFLRAGSLIRTDNKRLQSSMTLEQQAAAVKENAPALKRAKRPVSESSRGASASLSWERAHRPVRRRRTSSTPAAGCSDEAGG